MERTVKTTQTPWQAASSCTTSGPEVKKISFTAQEEGYHVINSIKILCGRAFPNKNIIIIGK